jgi:hypothetical protein
VIVRVWHHCRRLLAYYSYFSAIGIFYNLIDDNRIRLEDTTAADVCWTCENDLNPYSYDQKVLQQNAYIFTHAHVHSDSGMDWTVRRSNTGRANRFFSSPKRSHRHWGPPNLLFNGYHYCFPGVKRLEREVGHSHPSSAQVKNEWSYISASPLYLHSVDRDNFFTHAYVRIFSFINPLKTKSICFI